MFARPALLISADFVTRTIKFLQHLTAAMVDADVARDSMPLSVRETKYGEGTSVRYRVRRLLTVVEEEESRRVLRTKGIQYAVLVLVFLAASVRQVF
mgnify:CR=1 FL=1